MSVSENSCSTDSCSSPKKKCVTIAALLIMGLSVMVAGYQIMSGLKLFRSYDRYVTVKGLATKDVMADLAVWSINFTAVSDDLPTAQAQLDASAAKVLAYFKSQGFNDDEMRLASITVTDKQAQTYGSDTSGGPRYILAQAFSMRTSNIENMVKASQNIATLIKDGVLLGQPNGGFNPAPQYLFTKLNDVKPEMIAEATKNARNSAEQFAKDSGQKVGQIRSANQGIFEILARDPSVVENETPKKSVRVVSTIDYYLE